MSRILMGGLIGGLVVFVWSALSHMVLPLGTASLSNLPGEARIAAVLRQEIRQPGFYFLPGMPTDPHRTAAQKAADEAAWTEAYRRGPSGILVIQPAGREPSSARQLVIELITDILAAAIAAMLLYMAAGSLPAYAARVLFVTMLGVFASVSIDFSYWNWYGFPDAYAVAAFTDQALCWFFGGLAIAAIVRRG